MVFLLLVYFDHQGNENSDDSSVETKQEISPRIEMLVDGLQPQKFYKKCTSVVY
jgi:hypothetical protein